MKINTERFGQVNIPADKVITLTGGVIGFEGNTRFIMLDFLEKSPLKWLQSTEDHSLAFVVCDPWHFFKDYDPDISDDDKKEIKAGINDEVVLLTIVTVPADISQTSLNLLSPIVVNLSKMVGKQVILFDSAYTTRHRIFKVIKFKSSKLMEKEGNKSKSV